MKTLIGLGGSAFGYLGYNHYQTASYYFLLLLSILLILSLFVDFKMLPRYVMDVRINIYNFLTASAETFEEIQQSKKAEREQNKNIDTSDDEVKAEVETQEDRRLRIIAENIEKETLLEQQRTREEGIRIGRKELLKEQQDLHEFEYFQEHGISIENNRVAIENMKNDIISLARKKISIPKLTPNLTND